MKTINNPWAQSINQVIETLETNINGLNEEQAIQRLSIYGDNVLHNKKTLNGLVIFLKQFGSPLIFLLIGAAILTGLLSEWVDMWVIIFVIILNVALGFYHEYRAENTLSKLSSYIKDRARVIRNGHDQEIDSSDIVPGDIVKLSYGSRVPADARVIMFNNLRTDETVLTGESLPVGKDIEEVAIDTGLGDRHNIVYAGTLVVEGGGHAVVYATGDNTEFGKIAQSVSSAQKGETPLQKGVTRLAWMIFIVVMILVLGILFLGITRGNSVIDMLVISTSVAVGAVPESLPIALTVILAIGSEKLARNKGVIRKLAATETLGSATLIMTDKTGTLTQAKMELVTIASVQDILDNKEIKNITTLNPEQKNILQMSSHNIDVTVENPDDSTDKWEFIGRPFEVNIARMCIENKIKTFLDAHTSIIIPFNSTNKFSVADGDNEYIIMGAPDILLKKSNISKEEYVKIESWIEKTSNDGKRIIGIAKMPKTNSHIEAKEVENIEFVGMLVFYDPIRPEVPQAIKNIEEHGIKIILVTGDLVGTATSIAENLGWKIEKNNVLTGYSIKEMSDEQLLEVLPSIKIFARVTPEDKLRIGKLYQKLGEVVAMTGDGVNDAPALKAMDIGISLGSGSDVAKSAADLVLLDDNFQTISFAIDEGRHILGNIRKTFAYLLSTSFDEVVIIGGSLLASLPLPISPLLIVWVNLFTGSLPSLAFAFDENVNKKGITTKNAQRIFTPYIRNITIAISVLSSILLFGLYYMLLSFSMPLEQARSIFFICFSSYTLVIVYSFRNLHQSLFSYKIFSNKKLNISILISLAILLATVCIPQVRHIFDLAAIPLRSLPFVIIWLIINVGLVEIVKYFFNKKSYSLVF